MTRDGRSSPRRGRDREVALAWTEATAGGDGPDDGDVTVTRLRPGGRPPVLVAVLLAAVVVVAFVKPWGEDRASRPAAPAVPPETRARAPVPPPAAPPAAEGAIREHCLDPGGWRVFAREGTGQGTIRSWKTLLPASGRRQPDDPAIPVVPVGAPELQGLGYCAPWRGDERPPTGATLSVWVTTAGGGARPLEVRRIVPRAANVLGGLFAPSVLGQGASSPAASAPPGVAAPGWPDGGYVFAVRAAGYERWWRVEVLTGRPDVAGTRGPSPTPPR